MYLAVSSFSSAGRGDFEDLAEVSAERGLALARIFARTLLTNLANPR